jgi:hypothetical protein
VFITIGRGSIFCSSVKQRLTAMSSTEAEIIAVSDALSQILWTKNFLSSLGWHSGSHATLEQDNTGAIRNLLRGQGDSQSRLKHMDVRYFTITRYIDSGDIVVEWVPTDEIIADVLTKPLQGSQFYALRAVLLGE